MYDHLKPLWLSLGREWGREPSFKVSAHAWVAANFILILDHCMMNNYIPPQSEGKVERRCVPGGIEQMGQKRGFGSSAS